MPEPTSSVTTALAARAQRAATRKATLRLRLQIEALTRALDDAKVKVQRRRPAMTARELHHALAQIGESLADCQVALDLGGLYADVLGVKWNSDPQQWYLELELGPVRLRKVRP